MALNAAIILSSLINAAQYLLMELESLPAIIIQRFSIPHPIELNDVTGSQTDTSWGRIGCSMTS